MSEDCRLSTGLPDHPKMLKIQRRLGHGGCWAVVCLFLWVANNRSDGNLTGMSDEDIELAARWSGDQGALVRQLVDVRFLDGESGSYVIHDWAEHNPWAAARGQRIEAARRAAVQRWNREPRSEGNATDVQPACDPDAHRMRRAPNRNAPTPPNPTHPTQQSAPKNKSEATAVLCELRRRPQAFTPPSPEEVRAYCRERGSCVDPQQWFDHYSSNGWKVGRNPMRDWKASVRTWERNGLRPLSSSKPSTRAQANQDSTLAARDAVLEKFKQESGVVPSRGDGKLLPALVGES